MKTLNTLVESVRDLAGDEDVVANVSLVTAMCGVIGGLLGVTLLVAPGGIDFKNGYGLVVLAALGLSKIVLNFATFLPRNRVQSFDLVHASWPLRGLLSFTSFVLICAVVLPRTGHVSGPFWGGVCAYLLFTSVSSFALFWNPLKDSVAGFSGRWRQAWMEKHLIADLKNSL